ncbi:hypothetical protein D3C80_1152690 [compost metagenome]
MIFFDEPNIFSDFIGLKADSTNAGYSPARMPVRKINPINENQIVGSDKASTNGLSNIFLNRGSVSTVHVIASVPEIIANNRDSVRNCAMRLKRCAPTTFRIATSFALFWLRAVLRLIKLIQAINKINKPIPATSLT